MSRDLQLFGHLFKFPEAHLHNTLTDGKIIVCNNKVYAGRNKIDLTKDTVYVHPSTKQCNFASIDVTRGSVPVQVGDISLPNYSTYDAFFYIVDGSAIRNAIGYKKLTRVSYPEMILDITIIGSWYSSGTISCYVKLNGYDLATSDSSNYVVSKYDVCTGGSEITGTTYTVTIPAADAICVPGTAFVSNTNSVAACSMSVHFSSSSKIRWDTFIRVSVRNQTNIINYTQLNF